MKLPKKFRPLIAALGALIVIGVAYLLIITLTPPPPEKEEEPRADSYQMVKYELKDLDHVTLSFADGYEYTIQLTHKSSSSRSYAIVGKEEYDFNFTSLSTACMSMSSITTTKFIEADADFSKYGLDHPQAVAVITGVDGTSTKLTLGDTTAVGSYTYCVKNDERDVYMLSSYVTRYLLQKDYAYRNLSVTKYSEESPTEEISAFSMSDHDQPIFAYRYLTDEEMEANPDRSVRLWMTYPIEYSLNDVTLTNELINSMLMLSAKAVVEDAPADLAKYGLTSDLTVLEFTNMDGTYVKLTMSQPHDDGLRYGLLSGQNSVFSFKAEDFEFVSKFDYTKTLYRLLWMYNITDLAGFDLTAHGVTYNIELFDPTKEEKDNEGKTFHATFNGKELREENCRRLYVRVLSPSVYDLADPNTEVAAEPDWSAVIHFDTGRADETIAFYKMNARQYAAYRNGKPTGFFVNLIDLQDIDEAIDLILRGELIPS